ncbi:MAG: PAS domain S-box protein [Anaerohalosphaera sp.]|nr:PAS domain S-box protein [Anaerohalosphaera sp.]
MVQKKDSVAGSSRNEERHFRNLIEILPHGVEETDLKGKITFSNEAHAAMLGYTVDEIVGKKIWDMLASEQDAAELKKYFKTLVNEQPEPTPYVAASKHKDGSDVITQVDWTYKYDGQGKLAGFVAVLTDITERTKAEVRVERLTSEIEIYESRRSRLTPRETEVMYMVAQGKPNKRIGKEMGISPRTVEIHRKRVMDKMEVGSVAELVRYLTVAHDLI